MLAISSNKGVIAIASHVSLTGLLYGLDTGCIGPVTEMPQFAASVGHFSSTQQGIFVACILLSAALSSLASGYVSDRISRRYGILAGGLITMAGTAISAGAVNLGMLFFSRLLTGIGAGQAIAVTTVYLVEVAPVEVRGVVACMVQLYVVVGILAGYFITFGSQHLDGSLAWRVPFIIQALFAFFLCLGMPFLPSSPRWLTEKGRKEEAREVLHKLRSTPERADIEANQIEASVERDRNRFDSGFREMFTARYYRRTLLGVFLMAFQQLTGIDAVLYFAPILFQQAGFTSVSASFLASGVTGIVNLLCTIPAQIWIDRWGRRKPLIVGGGAMTICLLLIGSLYAAFGVVEADGVSLSSSRAQWAVTIFIYIFVGNFSWSWAVVGKIYACEIIPTRLRASVCAVEQLANWAVNFAVALSAPPFLRSSPEGPYFLYGFATLVAIIVCWSMPETKGRSLEEIAELFEGKVQETRNEEIKPESGKIIETGTMK